MSQDTKMIINSGESVVLNTNVGQLTIHGHGAITMVSSEQLNALKKRKDFNKWVDKGYIIINAPLNTVNDIKQANDESLIAAQNNEASTIKLEALADAIMANEGINNRDAAIEEARKRLSEEAEKAAQAGDDDAEELSNAAKATTKKESKKNTDK